MQSEKTKYRRWKQMYKESDLTKDELQWFKRMQAKYEPPKIKKYGPPKIKKEDIEFTSKKKKGRKKGKVLRKGSIQYLKRLDKLFGG